MDNRKTAVRSREVIMKLSGAALFAALAYVSVFVFRIKVQFLTFDAKDAILVSTGKDFLPYVDQIVAALDHPGSNGGIQGTGVARIAYTPKYRAAQEHLRIFVDLRDVQGSDRIVFECDLYRLSFRT